MKQTYLTVQLSHNEQYFLVSQFGQVIIMGWEDPYKGWLIDELEEDQLKAKNSLLKKDYIRIVSEDEISIDQVLAAMIETCVFGDYALTISSEQKGGYHKQAMAHFKGDFIVEHVVVNDGHELTAIQDQSQLESRYQSELRLGTKVKGSGESFSILEDDLFSLEGSIKDGEIDRAKEALAEGDLEVESADKLIRTLNKPVANSSIVAIANRQDKYAKHVRGMAFLEGEKDLWIMQPYERNGKQWVEFTPADGNIIVEKFRQLLPVEI